jgi:hypothetical protein
MAELRRAAYAEAFGALEVLFTQADLCASHERNRGRALSPEDTRKIEESSKTEARRLFELFQASKRSVFGARLLESDPARRARLDGLIDEFEHPRSSPSAEEYTQDIDERREQLRALADDIANEPARVTAIHRLFRRTKRRELQSGGDATVGDDLDERGG